jgi:HEPN domain-containing protein
MNPNLDELKEWLQISEYDLISAKILLSHEPPILITACFHCQQSIEKSLKAFLTWKGERFEKVHNIGYLLDLCEKYGLNFEFLNKNKAETITSYAVEMRYPLTSSEITKEEAQEAFDIAEIIYKFVINLIKL